MVNRLLSALEYPQLDSLNVEDQANFRRIVVWLEQNKLGKATPNTLNSLKNINSNSWPNAFLKYKEELECPNLSSDGEQLHWLLGYAVQMKTHENRDVYLKHAIANVQTTNVPNVVAENPLDKLNFRSKEFTEGIGNVAKLLNIPAHPDSLITLKAVSKVITARLSAQAMAHPNDVIIKGTPFPYENVNFGFDLTDPVQNKAAKVLGILYIHDLRSLQTSVNELIVAVQSITANPKTDTRLGKVGR